MQLDEKNTRIELLEAQITDFKKISDEYKATLKKMARQSEV